MGKSLSCSSIIANAAITPVSAVITLPMGCVVSYCSLEGLPWLTSFPFPHKVQCCGEDECAKQLLGMTNTHHLTLDHNAFLNHIRLVSFFA
jgi:hypothetical protein